MNEVALLSFADFATTWDFATHQSLHVQIGLQAFSQPRHRRRPLPLPETVCQASQAELSFRADAWLQHKQSLQRSTSSSQKAEHLDALAELWSERAERHLVRAAGFTWHDRFRQHGRVQKVLPRLRNDDMTWITF